MTLIFLLCCLMVDWLGSFEIIDNKLILLWAAWKLKIVETARQTCFFHFSAIVPFVMLLRLE